MLYRVEVRVIHVGGIIPVITNGVLPESVLPYSPLTAIKHDWRPLFDGRQGFRKYCLDRTPTPGIVGIVFGQRPQAMHMLRQDHPRIDVKGRFCRNMANRVPQRLYLRDEKIAITVAQIDREEIGSSRNPVSAIVGHGAIMPRFASRRNRLLSSQTCRAEERSVIRRLHSARHSPQNVRGVGGLRSAYPPYKSLRYPGSSSVSASARGVSVCAAPWLRSGGCVRG